MPGLPPAAIAVLDTAAERFSEKPIKAVVARKLAIPDVRRAMAMAARAAGPDQTAAVIYSPGHADALVVMRVDDLPGLLTSATNVSHTGE